MEFSLKSKSRSVIGFMVSFLFFAIFLSVIMLAIYLDVYSNGFKKSWNKYLSTKMYEDAKIAVENYCNEYQKIAIDGGEFYSHYYDELYSKSNSNFRFSAVATKYGTQIPGYYDYDENKQKIEEYRFAIDKDEKQLFRSMKFKSLSDADANNFLATYRRTGYEIEINPYTEDGVEIKVYSNEQNVSDFMVSCYIPSTYTAKDEYYMTYYSLYAIDKVKYLLLLLWVVSAVFMGYYAYQISRKAGHIDNENITIGLYDKFPLELILGCIALYSYFYYVWFYKNIRDVFYDHNSNSLVNLWSMIKIVFITMILGAFIASLINTIAVRCKKRVIINNTIIYGIGMWLSRMFKRVINALSHIKSYIFYIIGFSLIDIVFIITALYIEDTTIRIVAFLAVAILFIIEFVMIFNVYLIDVAINKIANGEVDYKIDNNMISSIFRRTSRSVNRISDGMSLALQDTIKSEHFKTELITNVSHDIKTPLTSIITYVNLLNRSHVSGEDASEYLEVLEKQSEKLKKLIEDLIEASKASTGNLKVDVQAIDCLMLTEQAVAEYESRLEEKDLKVVINNNLSDTLIMADGNHLWRVIDNLLNNVYKYALEGTRVFIDLETKDDKQSITFKNISKYELNISPDELTERFVRGDKSRTMDGSGLGLSIARGLVEAMNGSLIIDIDGDYYKATILLNRPDDADNEVTDV